MLNIQKVYQLVPKEVLQEFKEYLVSINATLPLKLINFVEADKSKQKNSDKLCQLVYGNHEEKTKKKFFQLAHHTFKLTSYISRNYPSYLYTNLLTLEALVNKGEIIKAKKLAGILSDIAEKKEDFITLAATYRFYAQHSFIMEQKNDTIRYHQKVKEVLKNAEDINEIYFYMRQYLNIKDKQSLTNPDIENHLSFFVQYHNSEHLTIKTLSRYASCYTLSFLNDKGFYAPEILKELEGLNSELDKHPYVIFPFADDISMNIDYLMLKHKLNVMDEEEMKREAAQMLKRQENIHFWKNYVNTPVIISLSILSSYYLTRYCYNYRKDFQDFISPDVKEQLELYKKNCEEIIKNQNWEDGFHVRYINLNTIYCCFLALGSKEDIKRAVGILERLLVSYQQISFQKLYDSVFALLIVCYFALQDYENVAECYKRYEKLTANTVKTDENEISIKVFYYASQWLKTNRQQYLEKINNTLAQTYDHVKLDNTRKILTDMLDYFYIPYQKA
jgi:hypothetical protein